MKGSIQITFRPNGPIAISIYKQSLFIQKQSGLTAYTGFLFHNHHQITQTYKKRKIT